jgi:hypothetical protein
MGFQGHGFQRSPFFSWGNNPPAPFLPRVEPRGVQFPLLKPIQIQTLGPFLLGKGQASRSARALLPRSERRVHLPPRRPPIPRTNPTGRCSAGRKSNCCSLCPWEKTNSSPNRAKVDTLTGRSFANARDFRTASISRRRRRASSSSLHNPPFAQKRFQPGTQTIQTGPRPPTVPRPGEPGRPRRDDPAPIPTRPATGFFPRRFRPSKRSGPSTNSNRRSSSKAKFLTVTSANISALPTTTFPATTRKKVDLFPTKFEAGAFIRRRKPLPPGSENGFPPIHR